MPRTHIHTYTHIHTHTHTYAHTHIYTYTHIHIYTPYASLICSQAEELLAEVNCDTDEDDGDEGPRDRLVGGFIGWLVAQVSVSVPGA